MTTFEQAVLDAISEIPYDKNADAGMYKEGFIDGFEMGAYWAYAKLRPTGFSEKAMESLQVRETSQKS